MKEQLDGTANLSICSVNAETKKRLKMILMEKNSDLSNYLRPIVKEMYVFYLEHNNLPNIVTLKYGNFEKKIELDI